MELYFCDCNVEQDCHDDFSDLKEAKETGAVGQRVQVDQRYLHDVDAGGRDHSDRCRSKTVESLRDIRIVLEFFEKAGDDQDDDD